MRLSSTSRRLLADASTSLTSLTPAEVAEVVFQMATYGGAPCTVEGLRTLKRVLEQRGEWKPAD